VTRYRILTFIVLALCLVAILSACGGGSGGSGY
jgi:nitrate reductase NapE component